jgi:hypothetical protein
MGDLGINGKTTIEWILEINSGKMCTGFIWLRIGTLVGSCEHSNEPSDSIKYDYLGDYQLLKIDSIP